MHNINISLFRSIYDLSGNVAILDQIIIFFTKYLAYGAILIVGFYLFYITFFQSKDSIVRLHRFAQGLQVFVSLFVTWGIVSILKGLLAYPRPFVFLFEVKPLVDAIPYESFPSAHAALTMALATAVFFYHRRLGKFLIFFSILVAISRVYVGVHYPIDVIAGLLLGFLISWGIHRIFARA